jgi:dTDP-4-amino-4,6-dideoxygalactose transaminase
VRDSILRFALPDMDQAELDEIKDALDSNWITTGPKTRQFQVEFAEAVGAKHAVAVNSCTAAMHLALEAVGLNRGDEVITTPYSFAATAEVVHYFGATPVLVDIRREDLNLDPALIEPAITARTKAILPVHIAGLPAELDEIYEIAVRYGLAVVEDAAHAFPARYKNHIVGSANAGSPSPSSHAVCFSFYATKAITTGEGGMITTDDPALAERCRIMALHGINRDAWNRYGSSSGAEQFWYYEIVAPGFKYNMTDIAAAMGLAQLQKAERMWQRRSEVARRYNVAFVGVPELQIPHDRADCQHAWHLYMLRLNLERLRIDRTAFVDELLHRNISTSVHFIPLHLHAYYQQTYGYGAEDFPVASGEYQREISLPIYSRMSDRDVQDVIDAVVDVVELWRC